MCEVTSWTVYFRVTLRVSSWLISNVYHVRQERRWKWRNLLRTLYRGCWYEWMDQQAAQTLLIAVLRLKLLIWVVFKSNEMRECVVTFRGDVGYVNCYFTWPDTHSFNPHFTCWTAHLSFSGCEDQLNLIVPTFSAKIRWFQILFWWVIFKRTHRCIQIQ